MGCWVEDIPEVERRWVVNRIVVTEEMHKILDLLKRTPIHVPIKHNALLLRPANQV